MPKLLRFLIIITCLHLVLFTVLRVSFWQYFNNPSDPMATVDLGNVFYLGLKFDLQLSLVMILPIFVLGNIRYCNPFNSTGFRYLWIMYLVITLVAILLIYLGNFGHFAYLGKPIDATMLRFFDNPIISSKMVWQSYPVIEWASGFSLLIVIYLWFLNRLIINDSYLVENPRGVFKKMLIASIASSMVLFGLYGKISYYPLRWSDAFFSPHTLIPAVTSNPVIYFLNTFKNRQVKYSDKQSRKYYNYMARYLKITSPNKSKLNYVRKITSKNKLKQEYNVVMVFLESFSAYKSGLYGNPLKPTPHFDKLATSGYFFKRFFTPSTGTARSVFTALTGIPDVEPKKTSSRNPLIVDQHLIINDFKKYNKLYFLGGSASWGNIRGLLSKNIEQLELYEEGSYSSPRADVWGIDDYHLFQEANTVLRKIKNKPFFAVIQTAGNHRPYTIPNNIPNFKLKNIKKNILKQSGFINNGEYNAYRFLDFSIGAFIAAAKKEAYFENTLFVFFGDHGVPGSGKHIKPSYQQLGLINLHVPLVFYAPKLIRRATQFNKIASEVDIMPSIAGLLNIPYTNSTLGRDLFDRRFDKSRYAFTVNHGNKQRIGLINNKFYFQMDENGDNTSLHNLESQSSRQDISKKYKRVHSQMRTTLNAINSTINYMRYHNAKMQINKTNN